MSVIDSIQISGVTYTIQGSGGGGNPTVEVTQAEYDALVTAGTVSADTYYIITDAQAGDLTNYYTKTETNTLLGGLKLVKLTQSEYDNLGTKDDNTVYFIGDSTNGYTMKIGNASVN